MALGFKLQDILRQQGSLPGGYGTPPYAPPRETDPVPVSQQATSKGDMIAGLLGGALSQVAGGQDFYTQALLQQRQQQARAQQEEAVWSRRQTAEDQQWQRREQFKRDNPEPTALERNLQAWQRFDPQQRQAYQEMQKAQQGDPDVVTTLPNGQLYAGPRSGLQAALTGQGAAVPSAPPSAPVGKLRPMGGPSQPATGGFRR